MKLKESIKQFIFSLQPEIDYERLFEISNPDVNDTISSYQFDEIGILKLNINDIDYILGGQATFYYKICDVTDGFILESVKFIDMTIYFECKLPWEDKDGSPYFRYPLTEEEVKLFNY